MPFTPTLIVLRNIVQKTRLGIREKKVLSILLKAIILILAAVFIAYKLTNNNNLKNFNNLIKSIPAQEAYITIGVVIALMLVNWLIEAVKWRFLVKNVQRINLWTAIESVFCGLTLAVFTPNRIGEYGGRVFFLSPSRRVLGLVAMGIGSVGQMVITNILGSIALVWFALVFLNLHSGYKIGIVALACIFIAWLLGLLGRIPFLNRFKRFFRVLSRYDKPGLLKVFLLCLARFIVFTSQYCVLIHMLIPQMPIFEMAMMVFILFFIQSALPSLDLLDVGIRTLTASYFFSYITHQDVAIIAATAMIWLVNLIIPAILGSAFVFKLNFFGINRN